MKITPIIKIAGSKARQLDELLPHLAPKNTGSVLYDVFGGSGVVTIGWLSRYTANKAVFNDALPILCDLMQQVKTDKEFTKHVRRFFKPTTNTPAAFEDLRERFNSSKSSADRAHIFVYLTRHCFNGLVRFNKAGRFNSPFGKYENVGFPEDAISNYSRFGSRYKVLRSDFRECMQKAKDGDVVYIDPPYAPWSDTASFTTYTGDSFGDQDQLDLIDAAVGCYARGATVVAHNNAVDWLVKAYANAGAEITITPRRRGISCRLDTRVAMNEMMAVFK